MNEMEYLTTRELIEARKEAMDAGDWIQAAKYAQEICRRTK